MGTVTSTSGPAPGTWPAGTRIASYELVRCIGQGGMGQVYEARHLGLDKRVAIKTLFDRGSVELVARFLREGKAAARVRHPNVVDVVDVGVHDDTPYLVMEYLDGHDLGQRLEQGPPLSAQEAADLLLPLLSALQVAHDSGIIHRDLKPENIFLSQGQGAWPVPKLVDFGISKFQQQPHLTGTHDLLGTPYYMSPEQVTSARNVDHRSDLFSLGVILYRCVSGNMPFSGDSLYQVIEAIVNREPDLGAVRGVPAGFAMIVRRALEKQPQARYQSAHELGTALFPYASARVQALQPEFAASGTRRTGAGLPEAAFDGQVAEAQTVLAQSGVRATGTKRGHGSYQRLGLFALLLLAAAGAAVFAATSGKESGSSLPVQAASAPSAAGLRAQPTKASVSPQPAVTGSPSGIAEPPGENPVQDSQTRHEAHAPGVAQGPSAAGASSKDGEETVPTVPATARMVPATARMADQAAEPGPRTSELGRSEDPQRKPGRGRMRRLGPAMTERPRPAAGTEPPAAEPVRAHRPGSTGEPGEDGVSGVAPLDPDGLFRDRK